MNTPIQNFETNISSEIKNRQMVVYACIGNTITAIEAMFPVGSPAISAAERIVRETFFPKHPSREASLPVAVPLVSAQTQTSTNPLDAMMADARHKIDEIAPTTVSLDEIRGGDLADAA